MSKMSRYSTDYPEKLLDLMKKGCLPAEVAGKLGCRKEDVLVWLRDTRKSDFRDAFKLGMAASEAYWISLGVEAIKGGLGKTFKEKLYLYIMQSQFSWTNKEQEMDKVEREAVLSDEELDARIHQYLGTGDSNVTSLMLKKARDKKQANS